MTYIAKSNFIEYDAWFNKNINPIDLKNYIDEKTFSNNIHEKFNNLSCEKLVIGTKENLLHLTKKTLNFKNGK